MAESEELWKKRFIELANKAYQNNCYLFTGFLNQMEADCFYQVESQINHVHTELNGGYPGAERVMLRFGDPKELMYEEKFPICCIRVEPLLMKFADTFSHRDFLGALMNLGIERSEIGDIVLKDNMASVFVTEKMAPYIMDNLDQVRHTHVKCSLLNQELAAVERSLWHMEIQASSERIDGVIAKVCKLSRNACIELFRAQKIFVNGRLMENNSYVLKNQDVVSVRGFGKFIYTGSTYITKKGKQNIAVEIYQ